jgi:hypothetical protein
VIWRRNNAARGIAFGGRPPHLVLISPRPARCTHNAFRSRGATWTRHHSRTRVLSLCLSASGRKTLRAPSRCHRRRKALHFIEALLHELISVAAKHTQNCCSFNRHKIYYFIELKTETNFNKKIIFIVIEHRSIYYLLLFVVQTAHPTACWRGCSRKLIC